MDETFTSKSDNKVTTMESNQYEMKNMILKLTETVIELKHSTEFLAEAFEQQKAENIQLRKLLEESIRQKEETEKLREEVKNLQNQVNSIWCEKKQNNIIIAGVPMQPNEEATIVFENICNQLNVEVSKEEVLSVQRINIKKENSPIVVKLVSETIKKKIIQKRKEARSLFVNEVGLIGSNNMIYFNEDMTREMQFIFKEARKIKKDKGYKFLWYKSGNIFIRKGNDTPIIVIKGQNDFAKL